MCLQCLLAEGSNTTCHTRYFLVVNYAPRSIIDVWINEIGAFFDGTCRVITFLSFLFVLMIPDDYYSQTATFF